MLVFQSSGAPQAGLNGLFLLTPFKDELAASPWTKAGEVVAIIGTVGVLELTR
jgi:hypothetical protein